MPAYIKLCMDTWALPYTLLNYNNINEYTDLRIDERLTRFSLPQIADCVRVHVLRDQGGYWLDADTIMLTGKLPGANMIGNGRSTTIGYLRTKPHSDMFMKWAEHQDTVIDDPNASHHWAVMGNAFVDGYVKEHPEITVAPVRACWPETYMITDDASRYDKYQRFYFEENYKLSDLEPTDMLMLHNSWTPQWYKDLTDVLSYECTLSNILSKK